MNEEILHHTEGNCLLCERKLFDVNQYLADWFYALKKEFRTIHISHGYRGIVEQNKLYLAGKSKLTFPLSEHNKTDENNEPCSRALDLFSLTMDGAAAFPVPLYRKIDEWNKLNKFGIFNGGSWKTFKDFPHFELISVISQKRYIPKKSVA